MEELMVIGNPSKRRGKRRGKRRMTALQRRYFGGGRKKRRSRTLRNPVGFAAIGNPSKRRGRRRRSGGGGIARRARRAMSSYSIQRAISSPVAMLKPALIGAAGATIVNSVLARVPLPAMLMTGRVKYLTQGAAAIALGMIAQNFKFAGGGTVSKAVEGSLTVTLHSAIQDFAAQAGLNLGGMGYYLPGINAGMAVPSAGGSPSRMAGTGMYMTGPGAGGSVIPMRRAGMNNISTSFKF